MDSDAELPVVRTAFPVTIDRHFKAVQVILSGRHLGLAPMQLRSQRRSALTAGRFDVWADGGSMVASHASSRVAPWAVLTRRTARPEQLRNQAGPKELLCAVAASKSKPRIVDISDSLMECVKRLSSSRLLASPPIEMAKASVEIGNFVPVAEKTSPM